MNALSAMVAAAAVIVLTAGCMTRDDPDVAAGPNTGPFPLALFPEPVALDGLPAGPVACLTEDEMAATEMVRVHTMLMVTGLTCNRSFGDPALFSKYQNFTELHQERIRDTQSTLERFLGRHLPGNRARLFDSFQTQTANGEAMTVLQISARRYCVNQRNRFYTVVDFDEVDLRDYIDQAMDLNRETYVPCDEPRVAEMVQQ